MIKTNDITDWLCMSDLGTFWRIVLKSVKVQLKECLIITDFRGKAYFQLTLVLKTSPLTEVMLTSTLSTFFILNTTSKPIGIWKKQNNMVVLIVVRTCIGSVFFIIAVVFITNAVQSWISAPTVTSGKI